VPTREEAAGYAWQLMEQGEYHAGRPRFLGAETPLKKVGLPRERAAMLRVEAD
jgi:hypothetical protein